MRRPTTSHGGTVRFMNFKAEEANKLSKDCSASARLSQPSMMSRTFATVSCTFGTGAVLPTPLLDNCVLAEGGREKPGEAILGNV